MIGSLGTLAALVLLATPAAPRAEFARLGAELTLLDEDLRPPVLAAAGFRARPDLRAFAFPGSQPPRGSSSGAAGQDEAEKADGAKEEKDEPAAEDGALDFDLLGEAKPPPAPDDRAQRRRKKVLALHQASGIGLAALQLATTVVGQLNYNDRFGDSNTARYKLTHQVLAYSTVGLFAATGALAVFAPNKPSRADRGFDRVTMHKISMVTAAVGIATQAALGIYTASRDGFQDKQDWGRAHLVVGYATLAAVIAGVGALVY